MPIECQCQGQIAVNIFTDADHFKEDKQNAHTELEGKYSLSGYVTFQSKTDTDMLERNQKKQKYLKKEFTCFFISYSPDANIFKATM